MLDDAVIIRRCQTGQPEQFEQLAVRYRIPLYSLCRKLERGQDAANDLFQTTWVKALQAIGTCDPERRFISWLFSVAVNLYRDEYRKRKRWFRRICSFRSTGPGDEAWHQVAGSDPGAEQPLMEVEAKETLRGCVAELPDELRLPVLLFYLREIRQDDVAEILGIPAGTVKSRLARARSVLRQRMEEKGYE